MLTRLHIENIAVIEKAEIAFEKGLNVLTGETGAGKSMIIDAINAVLGERVSREIVRTGSERADVTALFTDLSGAACAALEEQGYAPDEDGCLLIRRTVGAEGKSSCRINGQPATAAVLREIGRSLVNIHGQHDNQSLLDPERHVDYLDQMGGLLPLREDYRASYTELCRLRSERRKVDMDEAAKARRMDMLRYQIDEIEAAALQEGEEAHLMEQRSLYRNSERIAESVAAAKQALTGDEESDGALARLTGAVEALTDAGRYVSELEELAKRAQGLLYELEECVGDLRGFGSGLEYDPQELDRIETRLELIKRLESKYGSSEAEVLRFLEQAQAEWEEIELSDQRAAQLDTECAAALERAEEKAARLTQARREAALHFAEQVGEQLRFLDMPRVRLEVAVEPAELSSQGADRVEFLISANPGEPVRPLARIASGGELSRIMLALKSVMAGVDDIDTLIFDEIDTGISGRAAQKVGLRLRQLGENRQILCVTHLAQIAAMGHQHLLIRKEVRQDRTYTEVAALNVSGREEELARIIGGEVTPANLQAAREMLAKAEETENRG